MEDIAKKVIDGYYKIKQPQNRSSEVWKLFGLVYDENDTELFGVASCTSCYTCLIYKKKDDQGKIIDYGTKNLIGHKARCSRRKIGEYSSRSLSSFFIQKKPIVESDLYISFA